MTYRKSAAMEARKDARRKSILDAAIRLFGSCGYYGTTVPMIVAEAKCAIGSFYAHFRNKEDIFVAVLELFSQNMAKVIDEARAPQPDPLQKISCAVEALFLYLAENPREARILIVESPGLTPKLEQVRRTIIRYQTEQCCYILKSSQKTSLTMDPALAAQCIVGATFEVLYRWLEQDPVDRPPALEMARAVADYNMRAICH